jgi:putative transposase
VNRFPELVAESVRQLKAVCPLLGKKGLAERLARAGLHLGVTTVGRMLKQAAAAPAAAKVEETEERSAPLRRPVVALYPGHAFQIDLTLVPTAAGFWVPWWPFSVLLRWPFAWWVAAVIDTSSRKVVAVRVFGEEPNARAMTEVVALAIEHSGLTPRYLLADKGRQFVAEEFRAFCEGEGVTVRYAAADSLGATAIIERFFRTLKTEWLRRIPIPLRADAFSAAIRKYLAWYHAERPHQGLGGRTPDEVFAGVRPKNEAPRIEPRPKWPRGAPCARPYAKPRRTNRRGLPRMVVGFAGGARELPTVSFVERR